MNKQDALEVVFKIFDCQNPDGRGLKIMPVLEVIDPQEGKWRVGNAPLAPCGCLPKIYGNGYRMVFYCLEHGIVGMLVEDHRTGKYFWTPGKLEVNKK